MRTLVSVCRASRTPASWRTCWAACCMVGCPRQGLAASGMIGRGISCGCATLTAERDSSSPRAQIALIIHPAHKRGIAAFGLFRCDYLERGISRGFATLLPAVLVDNVRARYRAALLLRRTIRQSRMGSYPSNAVKQKTRMGRHFVWRRERDSNPRGLAPNTLSKRAP